MSRSHEPGTRSRRIAGRLLLLALGFWLWSSPGHARAWSAQGHALVGDLATRLLTSAAAAEVAVLLRDDRLAGGEPSGRTTLGEVASWADEWRIAPAGKETGPEHYDDEPICGMPDKALYCRDGRCGTVWYDRQVAVLRDRSQPARARNEALKWIVHLVGDLHQPLHMSDHDDKGGNKVRITFLGQRTDIPVDGRTPAAYNLHTAWDRLIPYRAVLRHGGYARVVADLPTAATRADWEAGDMTGWSQESFVLARDFVYPALPVDVVCGQPITGIVPIDARLDDLSEVIAIEQLRKAGVRLARVLNDILGH